MAKAIDAEAAPKFDLPFSHAINTGDFVYISGQVGVNPETLEVVGGIKEQTKQCFKNIGTILKEQELTLDHIVKVNVFLADSKYSQEFNEIYKEMLKPPYPARTTVSVGLSNYLIEIDCIASTKSKRTE